VYGPRNTEFLNARLELGSASGKGYGRISFHENPYESLHVVLMIIPK
jgi:hypothetical protein